jgi:hypothetical protein
MTLFTPKSDLNHKLPFSLPNTAVKSSITGSYQILKKQVINVITKK